MSTVSIISQPSAYELISIVSTIKSAIMRSRYSAAKSVNKRAIALYFHIGEYIDSTLSASNWGDAVIDKIAALLQQELPGVRGFASSSIRKMRSFYNVWKDVFEICSLSTNKLSKEDFDAFMSVGFSHHYEIASKALNKEERIFYIRKCASEFWTVERLKIHIKEKMHLALPIKAHSFKSTITDDDLRKRALKSFKDEYLLNLVNLEDLNPDEIDERVLEYEIVHNIKSFIMAFGSDFAFMGNQYRLEVDGEDLFVDLLFYHRGVTLPCCSRVENGKIQRSVCRSAKLISFGT